MEFRTEEYNLAGEPWYTKEDNQLIKEYTNDKLSLLELCKVHKRMPGGIISRLKRLNLIDARVKARGYLEYQQSNLYKEICKNKQEKSTERKESKFTKCRITDDPIVTLAKISPTNNSSEIISLKNDIKEIKEDIKKIFELIMVLHDVKIKKKEIRNEFKNPGCLITDD